MGLRSGQLVYELITHSSDDSIVIRFAEEISPETASKVRHTAYALGRAGLDWISDIVPSYCEVLVTYDARRVAPGVALDKLKAVADQASSSGASKPRLVRIPVCYGGEFGPDMGFVTEYAGITEAELIRLHSAPRYLIYMIGFTIGFPYLGGMDARLAVPRLEVPRQKVPAGSVGIAGKQTGIYSLETPGGWQIIGRSPVSLVDISKMPPAVLSAGDYLQFYPIEKEEFHRILDLSGRGVYTFESSDCEAL
jgi:KipI family sensor histidine kinase inhibitor